MNKTNWLISMILLALFAQALSACGGDVQASSGTDEGDAPVISQPGNYLKGGQYSGDDAYDPAAVPAKVYQSGGFSGDDAYDLAAGWTFAVPDFPAQDVEREGGGFSGDDAYDPAAGGLSK